MPIALILRPSECVLYRKRAAMKAVYKGAYIDKGEGLLPAACRSDTSAGGASLV